MALEKHSKIYFNYNVTNENKFLDLVFNGDDYAIDLNVGTYTPTQLASEIANRINTILNDDFTVTFNRVTRLFTIANNTNFDLEFATGVNNTRSIASVIGFNATDLTGANTYTSQNASGSVYSTQFYIQSYKTPSLNRKAIDGLVNKSASGKVEVVKFGNERFMEGEFLFITDICQEPSSIIRTNLNGVSDYIALIEWLTEKAPVEIMIDESKVNEFQTFILESTEQDAKGLDYELVELYDRSLPLYYRSGKLKFRLME